MKKKLFGYLVFLFVFIGTGNLYSQVYTGGSIGISYDKGFYADVSPLLGYRYEIIDIGIAPFYSYREYQHRENVYTYGGRVFLQFTFVHNIFAHSEFELRNIQTSKLGPDLKYERKWIAGLPLGIGYRQTIAPKTRAFAMVLYDVLQDKDSSAENPVFRAGITYDF